MNALEIQPNGRQPRAISLGMALLGFVVFALVGLGALGFTVYYYSSAQSESKRRLDDLQAQITRNDTERKKGAETARLTLAYNRQDQLLKEVSGATNSLLQLLAECDALRAEAAALRTNEFGRRVALNPNLVPLARRFYESSLSGLPPESELTMHLEAVRRVGLQVAENRGTAYEPAPALSDTVQTAHRWSAEATGRMKDARAVMKSLMVDAQVKFTRATLTPTSPTLAAAIDQLDQSEASKDLQQAEQTTSTARTNAVITRTEADAQKIRADADRYAEEVRQKLAEEQAAKQRDWQEREAKLKLEETKTKVSVEKKADEARNVELRKKASDPAIQAKLAPFIAAGYVGIYRPTVTKEPFSYEEIQSFGALSPTIQGQNRLVDIAVARNDTVRPRWKFNPKFYRKHADEVQMVQEAQQLLIELGPVLVETGVLKR